MLYLNKSPFVCFINACIWFDDVITLTWNLKTSNRLKPGSDNRNPMCCEDKAIYSSPSINISSRETEVRFDSVVKGSNVPRFNPSPVKGERATENGLRLHFWRGPSQWDRSCFNVWLDEPAHWHALPDVDLLPIEWCMRMRVLPLFVPCSMDAVKTPLPS